MANFTTFNVITLTATTSTTIQLPKSASTGLYMFTSAATTLAANQTLTITDDGSPIVGQSYEIWWEANYTLASTATIDIFGTTIKGDNTGLVPASFAGIPWGIRIVYTGSAYVGRIMYKTTVSESYFGDLEEGNIYIGNSSDRPDHLDISTSGRIIVGDGTTAASVALSGDGTLSSAGALTIAANAITLTKLADFGARGSIITAGAAGAPQELVIGAGGRMLMSDGTDAVWLAMSGDATIDSAGALTIANDAIENAMMADDSISLSNLNSTGQLDSFTTTTGTPASTDETTLASFTLPTGAMDADGETLEIFAYGTTAANANNKTIRLYIGSTAIATNTTTAAPNALNWIVRAKMFRTGAAAQKGVCEIKFTGVAAELDVFTATETMASAVISITGDNGTASANDIVLEGFEVITNKEDNT